MTNPLPQLSSEEKLSKLTQLLTTIKTGVYSKKGKFTNIRNTNIFAYVKQLIECNYQEEELCIPYEPTAEYCDKAEYYRYECFVYKFDDIEILKMLSYAYTQQALQMKEFIEEEFNRVASVKGIENTKPFYSHIYGYEHNMIVNAENLSQFYSKKWSHNKIMELIEAKCKKYYRLRSSILRMQWDYWAFVGHPKDATYIPKKPYNATKYHNTLPWKPSYYESEEFKVSYLVDLENFRRKLRKNCPFLSEETILTST